jgi:ABC-type nickel/cobalt efflux system permease component RcnA
MSFTAPALLAAAAGVGLGHAVLPDHWVPLSVIARTQRYPLRRVLRLSALAGLAHVALSLLLGAILIGVGLQFRTTVERRENLIVGGLLLATGAVFLILELLGRGHGHNHDENGGHSHSHSHDHGHEHSNVPVDSHTHAHTHDPGHVLGHGDKATPDHTHQHATGTIAAAPPQHTHTHAPQHSHSRTRRLLAFIIPFGAAASPDLTILPVFLAASALGLTAALGTLVVFSLVTLATIVGLTMLGTLVGYQLRGAWIDKGANLITAAVLLLIGLLVATNTI